MMCFRKRVVKSQKAMPHRQIAARRRDGMLRFPVNILVPAAVLFLNVVLVTTLFAADPPATNAAGSKSVIDYWGDDPEAVAAMAGSSDKRHQDTAGIDHRG